MYGNAWARIMYGNAEFQIFLLFGRLVLEKLSEKAVPPVWGRQRGETVFLEAVPTWGLDAGLWRRASRRRAGPPGGTWEGDTLSGGLKPMLLSICSNPRLLGGTTENVMEPWRRDGRSQLVWVKAGGSLPFLLMLGLRPLLLQKSASIRLPSRVTVQPPFPGGKGPRQELVGLDWQPFPSRAELSLQTPGRCSQMMTEVSVVRGTDRWTISLHFNPKLASRTPVSFGSRLCGQSAGLFKRGVHVVLGVSIAE